MYVNCILLAQQRQRTAQLAQQTALTCARDQVNLGCALGRHKATGRLHKDKHARQQAQRGSVPHAHHLGEGSCGYASQGRHRQGCWQEEACSCCTRRGLFVPTYMPDAPLVLESGGAAHSNLGS
jgi:hypothetical protein